MDQRWRVRRTLYEGRWATATQSGISAPRFVRYPGPNFSTIATHRFRSAVRASVASLASWRAFGSAASSNPNLTAVTRSARKRLLASSSFRPPARTSSAVAFLGHRISHQRDVSTIWRAVWSSRAASTAGRYAPSMSAQSMSHWSFFAIDDVEPYTRSATPSSSSESNALASCVRETTSSNRHAPLLHRIEH